MRVARGSFLYIILIALILAAAFPPLASARGRPVPLRTEPVDGAQLIEAPQQIRLWMDQPIDLAANSAVLTDAAGTIYPVVSRVTTYRPTEVGMADQFDTTYLFVCSFNPSALPTLIAFDVPALPAGTYRMAWRLTNRGTEGEREIPGGLVFRIQPNSQTGNITLDPRSVAQRVSDLIVTTAVRPNLPGQNFLLINVSNTRRPFPAPITKVTIGLIPPGQSQPITYVVAQPIEEGRYQVPTDALTIDGSWRFAIQVERKQMEVTETTIDWIVMPPPHPTAVGVSVADLQFFAPWLMGLVLLLMVIVGFGLRLRRRRVALGA